MIIAIPHGFVTSITSLDIVTSCTSIMVTQYYYMYTDARVLHSTRHCQYYTVIITNLPIHWIQYCMSISLFHGYATLIFHVLVSPSHGHSNALNTLDAIISWCSMYMSHSYIDTEIHDIITACSWTTDTLRCYYTG